MASLTTWTKYEREHILNRVLRMFIQGLKRLFNQSKTQKETMITKSHVREWLYDNAEYVKGIVDEAKEVQITNLQIYPLFFDEINSDFNNFCRAKIAIEASTAIGCSTEEVAIAIEEIGLEHFK